MIKPKKHLKIGLQLFSISTSAVLLSACLGGNDTAEPPKPTITDIASDDERFDSLQLALETTGLDVALDNRSATYTVFAPTDDAFAALGDTLTTLLDDPDALAEILKYHVLNGIEVDELQAISLASTTQTTLEGSNIAVTLQDDKLFINNAQVIVTNVEAANGIIHAIDAVITPPTPTVFNGTIADAVVANQDSGLGTLLQAVQSADTGVLDALSNPNLNLTVFAPIDAAFEKIDSDALTALISDTSALTDVLQYHVFADAAVDSITAISQTGNTLSMLNGDEINVSFSDGNLFINGAQVVTKDIVTTNGTVHLIDTVLMPPTGNIVEVAIKDGRFTKLVEAVQAANLVDTLANPDAEFTVFAPTDAAFDALGNGVFESLINGDSETLADILTYHVIGGTTINQSAAIAANGTTLTTANGNDVSVTAIDGRLFINQSEVIITDVPASNGVIHVVDSVIVPPGTIYQEAVKAGVFAELSNALINAGVDPSIANEQATQTVLSATGLDTLLDDPNETFTVFVPTAEAFAALGSNTLNALAQNPDQLADILLYHTVRGAKIEAADAIAAAGTNVAMADGNTVSVTLDNGNVKINDANVVAVNAQASNGIIHFIDKVLLPQ